MSDGPPVKVEKDVSCAEERYFAFISYNRSDLSAAQFVQRTLEHFRYPHDSIKREYHPEDKEYVRKIFLDKTDLSGQGEQFERRLESALANSRYLIVICSPRAAQKRLNPGERHYVEWEIATFLRYHGNGAESRIIPVILEGEPDKKENSCLPEPLRTDEFTARNLPDMRPQPGGGGGKRGNWQSAIVTLLSYVFNVERSIIFDRFAAERAKTRARIAVGVMSGVLLAAVMSAWGIVEQRRAADQKAERHLVEAIRHLERPKEDGTFLDTGLGLAHLAQAARLPAAHDYLLNQLMQRSWIVPVKERAETPGEQGAFLANAVDISARISCPADFPLAYRIGEGVLSAHERVAASKDGLGKEVWHIGERTADGFWSIDGKVSPTGRSLVMVQSPGIGRPHVDIVAFNPFTGQRLWSRRTEPNVRLCAFSGDGNRLALLSPLGSVSILDAMTGEYEFETYEAGECAADISFAPDDNGILIRTVRGRVVECRLVKNLVEFSFRPTGYPIVAHALSQDGRRITFSMSTGGRFGVADTYDTRTFERLSRVDLTNAVARPVPRDATDAKSMTGRFRATSAKNAPNSVTISDNASKSGSGRLMKFPNRVKRLLFAEAGGQEYLLVLGGSMVASAGNAEFYAIVEPETGRIVRMRTGLPEQLDTAFVLGGDIVFSGVTSAECRLTVLPASRAQSDKIGFEAICSLLSGMVLDDAGVPSHKMLVAGDVEASGIWRRFMDFVESEAGERKISFVSEIPFSRLFDNTSDMNVEWRKSILSVIPGELTATECGWWGDLQRIAQKNYAYRHPDLSRTQVEMHFARLDRDEKDEALQNDPQVRYYADKITKLMLDRHPDAEPAKNLRRTFDNLFGE